MIHHGHAITVQMLEGGVAQCCFNVHLYTKNDLDDIQSALAAIRTNHSIQGLIITFDMPTDAVDQKNNKYNEVLLLEPSERAIWLTHANDVFNQLEDLNLPKVALLQHSVCDIAFEIALCCEYRIMSLTAEIGLTQHQHGIMPYLGGITRLPHIVGLDHAIEWILYGHTICATQALQTHAVDAVVNTDDLLTTALHILSLNIDQSLNWKDKQQSKQLALPLRSIEKAMVFYSIKNQVFNDLPIHHIPTSQMILNTIQHSIDLDRNEAQLWVQNKFLEIINSPTRHALDYWSTLHTHYQKSIHQLNTKFNTLAWIGEPDQKTIEQLFKQQPDLTCILHTSNTTTASLYAELSAIWAQYLSVNDLIKRLNQIKITTDQHMYHTADLIFDTDPKDLPSKLSLLYSAQQTSAPTYLVNLEASQSITQFASSSHYPIHLIGAYFFTKMTSASVVEIVCHEKTSEIAVQHALQFVQQLGHIPLLVKDEKGRFIHRVLSAYFFAFDQLLQEGINFLDIDQCLEHLGWNHGPAALADLIGIETCLNFYEQLQPHTLEQTSHFHLLYKADRLGQHHLKGFYLYEKNHENHILKQNDPSIADHFSQTPSQLPDQSIIDRLTIALCNEVIHCLADQTLASAKDADLVAVHAFGFPKHLGGPCYFIEHLGFAEYIALCNTYAHLGEHYVAPSLLHDVLQKNQSLFQEQPI